MRWPEGRRRGAAEAGEGEFVRTEGRAYGNCWLSDNLGGEMSKFRCVFVGVALVAGSLAGMASAAVMQATYRGIVDDDGAYDTTNLFGAGTHLGGLAYKLVFVYDPATPGATSDNDLRV